MRTQTHDAKPTPNSLSPTIISCIISSLFSIHPPKTIPHLWVVKRPVSRWSAMADSSSLETSLSAKIGCYQAQILLLYFSLEGSTYYPKFWTCTFVIVFLFSGCISRIKLMEWKGNILTLFLPDPHTDYTYFILQY